MTNKPTDTTTLDPDDAHLDAKYGMMIEEVAQQEGVEPLVPEAMPQPDEDLGTPVPDRQPPAEAYERIGPPDEPESVPEAAGDESAKFWIGREFTLAQFKAWWSLQHLGTKPFNAVGYHHTWRPNRNTWAGIPTLKGVFDYYFNERGWKPWGMGPHLYLYAGNGNYRPGEQLVYVALHPRYDGVGIPYRNGRWLHIEHVHDGDAEPFPAALKELSGQVLKIVCSPNASANRQIPLKFIKVGHNNPSSPQGIMYHRDLNPNNPPKSCPGWKVTHENLDADVLRIAEQFQM